MAFITGLNKPQGNQRRSIGQINQNFDLVAEQVNGNLDDSNISGTAGIKGSKLAIEALVGSMTRNVDQAIPDGVLTDIQWGGATEIGGDFFNPAVPYLFNFPVPGTYLIVANFVLTYTVPQLLAGRRTASIRVADSNGAPASFIVVEDKPGPDMPCYFNLVAVHRRTIPGVAALGVQCSGGNTNNFVASGAHVEVTRIPGL